MGLNELVQISNFYGNNEEIVLAGGGNTSYKDAEFLYIKASGTTLATIKEEGFVKMNREKLAKMWQREYSQDEKQREAEVLEDLMNAREKSDIAKRPSVETTLHNLFNQKFVVHTHPALVNGLTCSNEGEEYAKKLFGDDVIWISATMPGYVLSKEVKEKIEAYEAKTNKKANLLLLENHGIFVAADSIDEIKQIMDFVIETLEKNVIKKPDLTTIDGDTLDIEGEISNAIGESAKVVVYVNNPEIQLLTSSEDAFKAVNYAYTPDHMVYYKHTPLFVNDISDIQSKVEEYKQKFGFLPKVVAILNAGAFACGPDEKQANIVKMLFLDAVKISVYAKSFGGGKYMPVWLVDFINNWEVEAYRKSISEK